MRQLDGDPQRPVRLTPEPDTRDHAGGGRRAYAVHEPGVRQVDDDAGRVIEAEDFLRCSVSEIEGELGRVRGG